ncbi:MAG: hypothetical protein KBT03_09480 [Bacteroidales bacterium]|nr:hypothetical protein [Candidatus Scybalousia scybalohippi]
MSISDISLGNIKNQFNKVKNQLTEYFFEPEDNTITNLRLDIVGTETMYMSNEITDYFVENNTTYQDQIGIKPVVYTIKGEVGELSWYKKNEDNSISGAVAQKLTPVVSFLPSVSRTMSKIQDKALKVANVVDSLDNVSSRLLKATSFEYVDENGKTQSLYPTKQQDIYKYLRSLRDSRKPINVKTAWGNIGGVKDIGNPDKYTGYVIQDVTLEQGSSVDKTNISITLKEFRTTTTKYSAFDAKSFSDRLGIQKSDEENVTLSAWEDGEKKALELMGIDAKEVRF